MKYWIYENWVHDYTKIHKSDCPSCNDGKGFHNKPTDRFGKWLGPFESKQEAELAAKEAKRKTISNCSRCM